jgi:hypothetical protein
MPRQPPAPCLRCGELVLETEKRHYYSNRPEPVHHACFMRPIIGSVAHLEKRCGCFVPGADDNDDPNLTPRQAAQAALELWERLTRDEMLVRLSRSCGDYGEDE